MSDIPSTAPQRNIWLRALLMLLMGIGFQLAATLLGVLAVVQFVLALVSTPNVRLSQFGRSLGQYLRQIAEFVGFATEDVPFPFSDWP
ncbi:MAG: lipase [Curvibacter sp. PD_MW3]|nr:MAG: lipase [Curvibacter sp. PD_MW3]